MDEPKQTPDLLPGEAAFEGGGQAKSAPSAMPPGVAAQETRLASEPPGAKEVAAKEAPQAVPPGERA